MFIIKQAMTIRRIISLAALLFFAATTTDMSVDAAEDTVAEIGDAGYAPFVSADYDDIIFTDILKSVAAETKAFEVIDYAKGFLGTPYRRGSKGPKSFDCSGFTSYIFRRFDINLGASSRSQYLDGTYIDDSDVRPGDLVFFSGRRGGKTVGHVGIAVDVAPDGRITFIHAATSGGIRYDTYPDDGYYSNRYIGARRVF